MNSLKERYNKEVIPELKKELGYAHDLALPRLEKVVVNVGLGEALSNVQALTKMKEDIALITGQKPIVTKAKKAISNFNLRVGVDVGLKVTLRGERMWDFVEKLITIVLPRVKDFRGISRKAFDGFGNYSLGIREHTIFPEMDLSKVEKIRSLQVIIVTTAESDEEGLLLLTKLGMPFTREQEAKAVERMEQAIQKDKEDRKKRKEKRKEEVLLESEETSD